VNPYSEEDAERTERARTAFLGGLALAGIMGLYTLFGGGEERTTEVDSAVTELRGNNPVFTGRKVVLEPGGIFVRTDEDGRARLRIPEGLWREPVVTLYGMVDETRRDEGSAYQVVLGGEAPVVPAEVGDLLRELPSFAPAKDRFALLIGVSNYDDEAIPPVRCALNDVALMKGMAWKVMCVHPDNILTLEDPTQAQVRAGLRKVVEEASKRSNPWSTSRATARTWRAGPTGCRGTSTGTSRPRRGYRWRRWKMSWRAFLGTSSWWWTHAMREGGRASLWPTRG